MASIILSTTSQVVSEAVVNDTILVNGTVMDEAEESNMERGAFLDYCFDSFCS